MARSGILQLLGRGLDEDINIAQSFCTVYTRPDATFIASPVKGGSSIYILQ